MDSESERNGPARSGISVEAARATVRRDGFPVALTGREREVVVALAVQRRPVSTKELGAMLSPDSDDGEASNIVKVYVYRVRRRLGSQFIVHRDGGYVLRASVRIDAAEARDLVEKLRRSRIVLAPAQRKRHLALAASLRADPPPALAEREWYQPVGRSLRRLGHDLAMIVGREALEHGGIDDALRVGRELTYEDPCDEEAWELVIKAHLRCGEHPAAVQGFRFYESALAEQLQSLPSPHLRGLIAAHGHDRAAVAAAAR